MLTFSDLVKLLFRSLMTVLLGSKMTREILIKPYNGLRIDYRNGLFHERLTGKNRVDVVDEEVVVKCGAINTNMVRTRVNNVCFYACL